MPTRKRQPSSKRHFIAKATPLPVQAAPDTSVPAFGQRKRPKQRRKQRRQTLSPNSAKAD